MSGGGKGTGTAPGGAAPRPLRRRVPLRLGAGKGEMTLEATFERIRALEEALDGLPVVQVWQELARGIVGVSVLDMALALADPLPNPAASAADLWDLAAGHPRGRAVALADAAAAVLECLSAALTRPPGEDGAGGPPAPPGGTAAG